MVKIKKSMAKQNISRKKYCGKINIVFFYDTK